jgi:hypothetical protein
MNRTDSAGRYRYVLVTFLGMFLFFSVTFSQSLISSDTIYNGSNNENNIFYGVDKVVNTYLFKGVANLNIPTSLGVIGIKQNYIGRAIRTTDVSFWDDEKIDVNFDIDAWEHTKVVLRQSGSYYNASASKQGLSHIGHVRGTGGLRAEIFDSIYLESSAGYENNVQRETEGLGPVFGVRGKINDLNIEDYHINTDLNGEYVSLNDNRVQSLVDLKGNIAKQYDEMNKLYFDIRYKSFLYPEAISDVSASSIKNRYENHFSTRIYFNFGITDYLGGNINFDIENKDITHYYNQYYEGFVSTAANNNRKEFQMKFNGEMFFSYDDFFQSFRLNYNTRDEKNPLTKKYEIDENKLSGLINQSKQLDNYSNTTQLRSITLWNIGKRDTLSSNVLVSLFRYDTPSEEVNDDRDEFSGLVNIDYSRRVSEILSASVEMELQMIHYVYIKAENSANNLWNRRLRLSPKINIKSEYFSINPSFYVLSDYYAYDFEDLKPGVDSYSIREVGYNDSVYVKLSKLISFESRLKLRYFEHGVLLWEDFSESPQNRNYEIFLKGLIYYNSNGWFKIGCGIRYFSLEQKNIGTYALINGGYGHSSYAPETVVSIYFKSGMKFDISGWYEFQRTNKKSSYKEIPNLLLSAHILI